MYCCAGCFDDIHLSNHINKIAMLTGNCSYCGAVAIGVIAPAQLRDEFQAVAAAYLESSSAEALTLLQWFNLDWKTFSLLDDVAATKLLCDILDDEGFADRKFQPVGSDSESPVVKWSEFRDEMLARNRFFFRQNLDLVGLKKVLEKLGIGAGDFGFNVFRARICEDDHEFQLIELGMPPAKLAKSGRANPVGIPYLYTASTPTTAVAEVRPHPGDRVCVARIELSKSVRLVDLRNPRRSVSPVMTLLEEEIADFRHQMPFLAHLEEELSKPVLPRAGNLEYLPTQYLCEFIKNCGFDGVVFRSSLSEGVNVTLFNESHVRYADMQTYEVTRLSYSQRVTGSEQLK